MKEDMTRKGKAGDPEVTISEASTRASMGAVAGDPLPEIAMEPHKPLECPVRVTRDVWLDLNGDGITHTVFRAGQVVPAGREARELLKRRPGAVAPLSVPVVACPGFGCGSPLAIDAIRASGELVVLDAAQVVHPMRMQLDVMHLTLATGDLLELKLDPVRAREVKERVGPAAFQPSGQSIFRMRCENCRGTVLVAIPKT